MTRIPYNLAVDAEILMEEEITHIASLTQWQFRMLCLNGGADVSAGFPDYLEFPDDRVNHHVIGCECLIVGPCHVPFDLCDRGKNVFKVGFVALHANAIPSCASQGCSFR